MHQCTKAISIVPKTLFILTQIGDYKAFRHIHQRNKTPISFSKNDAGHL